MRSGSYLDKVDKTRVSKPLQKQSSHIKKREEGFNVYLSGANEERVIAQRRREIEEGAKQGKRKQWKQPNVKSFDVDVSPQPLQRKKWDKPKGQQLKYPTIRNSQSDVDENYSDSFEEEIEQKDIVEAGEIQQNILEQTQRFVKNATKEQVDILKQSLTAASIQQIINEENRSFSKQSERRQEQAIQRKSSNPFKRLGNVQNQSQANQISQENFEIKKQDQPEENLEVIIQRITKLDQKQRNQIFNLLDALETGNTIENESISQSKQFFSDERLGTPISFKQEGSHAALRPVLHKQSKLTTEEVLPIKAQPEAYFGKQPQGLVLRVLSTWGNCHLTGLTEIKLYNISCEEIPIPPAGINIKNQGNGTSQLPSRMVNNIWETNNEKDMWLGVMPAPPQCLEIVIHVQPHHKISGIKIWNYNKSLLDSTKCVKELEILYNGQKVFQGTIQKVNGDFSYDYGFEIAIDKNFIFPKKNQIEVEIEEEAEVPEIVETPVQQQQLSSQNRPISVPSWKTRDQNKNKVSQQESIFAEGFGQGKPTNVQNIEENKKVSLPVKSNFQMQSQQNLLEQNVNQKRQETQSIQQQSVAEIVSKEEQKNQLENQNQQSNWKQQYKEERKKRIASAGKIRPAIASKFDPFQVAPVSRRGKMLVKPDLQQKMEKFESEDQEQSQQKESLLKKQLMEQRRKRQKKNMNIRESIEQLEFFKITNLGRIHAPERGTEEIKEHQISNQQAIQADLKQQPLKSINEVKIGQEQKMQGKQEQPITQFQQIQYQPTFQEEECFKSTPVPPQEKQKIEDTLDMFISGNQNANKQQQKKFQKQVQEVKSEKLEIFNPKQSENLVIPTLPEGSVLVVSILSTWGDQYYVGLSGIEIWDQFGTPIKLKDVYSQVQADPPDINILEGYSDDPRTIDKLFDGVNWTCDDMHV